jgi:hypothetical protein
MSDGYRPPSSRSGFYVAGFALAVVLFVAFVATLFVSGGFMHGD